MALTEPERAKQLMRDLCLSVNINSKLYISPFTLRRMYRKYIQWRQLVRNRIGWWNNNTDDHDRIFDFDRCLVHYLLERCYWIRYGDSDVVCDLLTILFEKEDNLGKIFGCQLSPNKPYSSSIKSSKYKPAEDLSQVPYEKNFFHTTWKTELLEQQPIQPIDYFMKHADKKKVLFGHKRLAEQIILRNKTKTPEGGTNLLFLPPCSMFFKSHENFRQLLLHGLFARAEAKDENVGRLLTAVVGMWASGVLEEYKNSNNIKKSRSSAKTLSTKSLFLDATNKSEPADIAAALHSGDSQVMSKPPPSVPDTVTKTLEMASMVLRTVERVDIKVLIAYTKQRGRSVVIPRILNEMSSQNVLPELRVRCFGPQDLQHLCRCQIRRRLYDNWQLPGGISMLPIPTMLKMYLNLEF